MATLLLAKRLTNQIIRAAEQAGVSLECDLQNYRNDGEREAAYCKGNVYNQAGNSVSVLTSRLAPETVQVAFYKACDGGRLTDVYNPCSSRAVEQIIKLLTPTPLTLDNLASTNITNLPNLENNPLLATYLSDGATGTENWTGGRDYLRSVLNAQGFDGSHFNTYPPSHDDKSYEVACVLWNNLAQSLTEPHMVCHHLLAYHDVRPSDTIKGRLAYYQDDKKRAAGIRTPIKVRKYLQKFFNKFRSPEALEHIAKTLDEVMENTDKYDVRIYTDANIDGWADAYYHISSCMSTQTKAYGVGERETYRCYCTYAMTNGKKTSGLSLVVLYQDGKPVARTITYTSSCGEECYVRNYGDDRLVKWLDERGYVHQQWLPNGTRLWTECYDSGNDEYLSPYVDGDDHDACATLDFVDGQPYWVISVDGVELRNCCGYTRGIPLTCDCCGDTIAEGYDYDRTDVHCNDVTLCAHCEDNHCYTVDGDTGIYVSESDLGDLIHTQTQGYYTQEYLDDHDWVVTGDGCVIDWRVADLCERSEEYYGLDAFEDISLEPDYVQKTWRGYINDNGRVYDYFYRQYGVYIDELDTYVHENHVDDVMAYLASGRSITAHHRETTTKQTNVGVTRPHTLHPLRNLPKE